jgi:predicted phage terminase large subunit-like protein
LLRRREARRSLIGFSTYTMPGYQVNWHHRLLCSYLDRFVTGEIKRLMVFMPPRHGKSELVSRRLPAYYLGLNPNAEVIAASYNSDLATAMNRDVQRIMDSQRYRNLFPQSRLWGVGARSYAQGTWQRRDDLFEIVGYRGKYRAAGVRGGITGTGMNLGVIDDPIKGAEEAYSTTIRQKVWDWYTQDFHTRLEKDASILLTMTRWHRDDLAGRLLLQAQSESDAEQWTVLRLPAIRGDEVNAEDPREFGEPLWPAKYDKDRLAKIRTTQGPNGWAALYDQDPRPEGGAWFDGSYFTGDIWFDEWPTDCVIHRVMYIDPSLGRTETCDYAAIIFLTRVQEGPRHVLYVDADIERRDTRQIVRDCFRLGRDFNPELFGVEDVGFQTLLASEIRDESVRTGYPLPIVTRKIEGNMKKETRIMGLVPYFGNREVRFRRNSRGSRLLLSQLMDFPLADYDDGPDALEGAIRLSESLLRGIESMNLPK